MQTALLIFATSLVATALSAVSGGGAGVINIPVMLALGIPFNLASAAQKAAAACWVLRASYNYLRGQAVDWRFIVVFSGLGLIGAYWGVLAILAISQRHLEIIVGVLILLFVAYFLIRKDAGLLKRPVASKSKSAVSYLTALPLGFYESFFGSGNGILFAAVAVDTRGFDLMEALGYYFVIAFAWDLFAFLLFAYKGYLDAKVFIPLAVGAILGGEIGTRYAKYKGNRFVRVTFVVIGTLLGCKLLLGF